MTNRTRWPLALLVLILAGFAASTFDTWTTMLAIGGVAVLFVATRRRTSEQSPPADPLAAHGHQRRLLWWTCRAAAIVVAVAIVAGWRLSDHLGSSINPIFVGIDITVHLAAIACLILWATRPQRGHVSMLFFGLIVVLLCVAAGGTSQSTTAQTTVALGACVGFVTASQIILGNHRNRPTSVRPRESDKGSRRLSPLFSLLTLSLILMITSAIATATSSVLPDVQDSLHDQLKSSLEAINDQALVGGTRYVRGSHLGSIRNHMLTGPNEVALRVYSTQAPGYLRGTVFDDYKNERWFTATNSNVPGELRGPAFANRGVIGTNENQVALHSGDRVRLNHFPLTAQRNERTLSVEVHNDPLKGSIVFLPLATRWLKARGSELVVNQHNTVRFGVDTSLPYIAGVGAGMPRQPLSENRRTLLLYIRDQPGAAADRVAAEIFREDMTPRAKAEATSNFFQSQFAYSLAVTQAPKDVDPLAFFLDSRHPAHCEYFASAAVMVLRSGGVPARYVTGYVCTELSDEYDYWLARNRDAHAWVEAYDDLSGHWFALEATPGKSYRTVDPYATDLSATANVSQSGAGNEAQQESFWSPLWGWLTSMRATDPLMVVLRIAQLPLFCVLALLLWLRYWRRGGRGGDSIDVVCRKMLRQADRLCRKQELVRDPHETLHQFALRIESRRHRTPESQSHNGQLTELALWYRHFAEARYRGLPPVAFSDPSMRLPIRPR